MKLLKDGVIPPIYSHYYRSFKCCKKSNQVPLNSETEETDDDY